MPPPPRIIAHRGLHRGTACPENSLAAMEAAWSRGIAWAECDVRFTADRRAVVLHDPTLGRTTNGDGRIDLLSFDDLKPVRLIDAHGRPTAHKVPLLHDVLNAMPPECGVLVEIKPNAPTFPHVARVLMTRGWRCQFQSFDPDNVRTLCDGGLAAATVLLVEDVGALPDAFRLPCAAAHLRHDLIDAAVVRDLRAAGRGVGAWTVNDPDEMVRLAALGVDTLITDEPLLAADVLRAR
ncbi:MAG TPA: glycerophosphodiester phosphodiesterase family protein [Tepidisphaeraceae bacterium]|nr:glycerophosphodiester phosphodiesterase family protein [Tepidisphaeraceae bacterium]